MMKMQKILVVDDSEMNRSILADMLEDEYEIIEGQERNRGNNGNQNRKMRYVLCFLIS